MNAPRDLYPPITPFRTGKLAVDAVHTLYWEECGNPDGVPVIFLHGGPGAGCSPDHRRFFDPTRYRIVLFDQRGAGRSTPHGEVRDNTTEHLIADMEALRALFGIPAWHVFGGSWGSTLAVAYAEAHPEVCLSLTLRGVFLMRASEIDWFLHGIRRFAPEAHQKLVDFLPESMRGDLLEGYWSMLNHADPATRMTAAKTWASFEARCATLLPSASMMAEAGDSQIAVGLARLEVHYMRCNRFDPDDRLLQQVDRVRHLPCAIVQGRYDLLCPPESAAELHAAWPGSTLQIIEDAGHSVREKGITAALVAIMDERLARG